MKISRRTAMIAGASLATVVLWGCDNSSGNKDGSETGSVSPDATGASNTDATRTGDLMKPLGFADRWLGDENAPVTIIEYASPTCSYCANFHNQVFPAFKEQFIDTGKVRFTLRPFSRSVLDAVVFMVAACDHPAADFYGVTAAYFETMRGWATSDDARNAMASVAINSGFTQESFEACLTNNDLFEALEKSRKQALDEFGVDATPTFFVNGKKLTGVVSIAEFTKEIDRLL